MDYVDNRPPQSVIMSGMNRLMANSFNNLLGLMHILFYVTIIAIGLIVCLDEDFRLRLAVLGFPSSIVGFLLLELLIIFCYIILFGFMCTIVAINSNLEAIRHMLSNSTVESDVEVIKKATIRT